MVSAIIRGIIIGIIVTVIALPFTAFTYSFLVDGDQRSPCVHLYCLRWQG